MTEITPIEPFALTFPQTEEGEEIKYRFMLTLSKKLRQSIGEETIESRLLKAVGGLDGIDGMQKVGNYTVEVAIARTFDPDAVIDEIKRRLTEDVLSDIVRPALVTP